MSQRCCWGRDNVCANAVAAAAAASAPTATVIAAADTTATTTTTTMTTTTATTTYYHDDYRFHCILHLQGLYSTGSQTGKTSVLSGQFGHLYEWPLAQRLLPDAMLLRCVQHREWAK